MNEGWTLGKQDDNGMLVTGNHENGLDSDENKRTDTGRMANENQKIN